jgi:hypothetical protein
MQKTGIRYRTLGRPLLFAMAGILVFLLATPISSRAWSIQMCNETEDLTVKGVFCGNLLGDDCGGPVDGDHCGSAAPKTGLNNLKCITMDPGGCGSIDIGILCVQNSSVQVFKYNTMDRIPVGFSGGDPSDQCSNTRVTIVPSGQAWVVGTGGQVFYWAQPYWEPTPDNSKQLSRIAVGPGGMPWGILADGKTIVRRTGDSFPGTGWEVLPGAASDIGVGPIGSSPVPWQAIVLRQVPDLPPCPRSRCATDRKTDRKN